MAWYYMELSGTWESQYALFRSKLIATQKAGRMGEGILAVGLPHNRGVARVMSSAAEGHSKGVTLIRKGKGKHILYTEAGNDNVHRDSI